MDTDEYLTSSSGVDVDMEYGLLPLAGPERPLMSISEDQFEAIRHSKASLLRGLAMEEAFDFVVEGYREFEAALIEVALSYLVSPMAHLSREDAKDSGLFNRRLMNWLTAVKGYCEQMPKHVAVVSKPSGDMVKGALNRAKVNTFGLRALLALRNYVQHIDSAVNLVEYKSWVPDETPGGQTAVTVNPLIRTNALRPDETKNPETKTALKDLQSSGQDVQLKPLVRECLEALWSVHSEARRELSPFNEKHESLLDTMKTRYYEAYPQVSPKSGLVAVARKPGEKPREETQVIWRFTEYRKYLEVKNDAIAGIVRRYVTS